MTTSELKTTSVDVPGLLRILGENLYSRPEVAVRELIQNASDAINRRKVEAAKAGQDDPFEPRIDVYVDPIEATLTIWDNGSGLTGSEIEEFLARIGSGFTRSLRAEELDHSLIGAFGLGFLTAYMIGDRVTMVTTPAADPRSGYQFVSDTGQTYMLTEHEPGRRGSEVTIHLKSHHKDLCDPTIVRNILQYYCSLLTVPIYFQDDPNALNEVPPWRLDEPDAPAVRLHKRRLEYAEHLEPYFEPIATLSVQTDQGAGLFWVHGVNTYGGSDNRRVRVYVRGMLVAQNKDDLLPSWAGFISGAYEASDLNPTASREDLQEDDALSATRDAIQQQIVAELIKIAKNKPKLWSSILRRHNDALMGAALADSDLYAVLAPILEVPTTDGDLPLPDIVRRSPKGLVVAPDPSAGADEIIARAFGTPVIRGYRYGAWHLARRWAEQENLAFTVLGTPESHAALFPSLVTQGDAVDRLRRLFAKEDVDIEICAFEPVYLPCLLLVDHEQKLRAFYESEEAEKQMDAGLLVLARVYTRKIEPRGVYKIIVNMRSTLVQAILEAPPDKAQQCADVLIANASMQTRQMVKGNDLFEDAIHSLNDSLIGLLSG